MRSNLFPRISLLVLLFLSCGFVMAQSQAGARNYKKISADSVRLRSSAARKSGAPAKKASVKKNASAGKAKKSEVDSVAYSPRQYLLGERVIMPGDSGRDVRSVAKILVNKLYIDEESLVYTSDGGVLYDGALIKAVKHFQEFNGMYPDGIIGAALVKALRKRKN